MKISILTLFPDFFSSILSQSILKRAQESGLVTYEVLNLRDFTTDTHQTTDDRPFGGGPGMVMKVEPIYRAVAHIREQAQLRGEPQPWVVLTSAKGRLFTQEQAQAYATNHQHLVFICGHYEGVDERVAHHIADQEVRIGNYVLTGGELAAAVMADAVSRLIPGVLGNELSNQDESHHQPGVGGYPQYTRPEVFQDWQVPPILLAGNHAAIAAWRQQHREIDGHDVASSERTDDVGD